MANVISLSILQDVVKHAAAFRCRVRLEPAGGPGAKVFPPTYEGGAYAFEKRLLPGSPTPVPCVLLDSVQSQANRMEETLQEACDAGRLNLPTVAVDFTPYFPGEGLPEDQRLLEPIGRITALQAPHRIADAILRDSLVTEENKPFRSANAKRESTYGRRLREVSPRNATPLFELCPTALLFGMWDSTGVKGGLGAKFERALVGEIVGINAVPGVKTSSRIDPLGIQLKAGTLYRTPPDNDFGWTLDPELAFKEKGKLVMLGKDGRPAEANHGNIPPTLSKRDRDGEYLGGGVTLDYAEQTIVLSLPALRRLRFPVNGQQSEQADVAARTVLAALGLCAAILMNDAGLDLRSRCLLWPVAPLRWELLGRPGEVQGDLTLDAEAAINLVNEAVAAAKEAGLPWLERPLQLQPSAELVKLVVKSQQVATSQSGEGGK